MRTITKALVAAAALAALAIGTTACGAAEDDATTPAAEVVQEQPAAAKKPAETPAEEPAETPAQAPAEAPAPPQPAPLETFVQPDFRGMNLQLAQDTLQSLGSYLVDQEDASGLGRLQVLDANWQVCSQNPPAGTVVPIDTMVLLSSVKVGESCP